MFLLYGFINWKIIDLEDIAMMSIKPEGKSLKGNFIFHILLILLSLTSGCGNKFFDPSQVGRFDHTPSVNVILDTLGVTEEESPIEWEQGDEPRPIDTVAVMTDYKLMPGDIIEVEIHELLSQGVTYSKNCELTETGKISIPLIGDLIVKGMTEMQLEETIRNILDPDILINPSIHVALLQSQYQAYSIHGDGIKMPGRYPIPRFEWRLLDALNDAKGASQKNVSYVYVARKVAKDSGNMLQSKNDLKDFSAIHSEYNLKEPVTLESLGQNEIPNNSRIEKLVVSSTEMAIDNRKSRNINRYRYPTDGRLARNTAYQFSDMSGEDVELENRVSVNDVLRRLTGGSVNVTEAPLTEEVPDRYNTIRQPSEARPASVEDEEYSQWIFQNNEWVEVKVQPSTSGGTSTSRNETLQFPQTGQDTGDKGFEWVLTDEGYVPVRPGQAANHKSFYNSQSGTEIPNQQLTMNYGPETETRLIKVPLDKLIAGDSRYNIVIKPGDSIFVPNDVAGVYYLMGNLNRTGSVEMTGGMVTLKQAIATAGNLGPLAWPKRCEITRNLGRNKEVTVRVDLEKIFNGEQPNIYIKPNDVINVGTHATSIMRAVLRNSFRATYGFGFVYDRNFANDEYYSSRWFD